MSRLMSLSAVTTLVTIPFAKGSAIVRKKLAPWYWKGIWVYTRVISVFLMARLTIYHTESIIYVISLDIIKETTTIITKFNGV